MIIPDINLLIYAYSKGSANHQFAKPWWEGLLNGREPVGIPWIVTYGYVRLIANPHVMEHPMSIMNAMDIVKEWLVQPCVLPLSPGVRHAEILEDLLRISGGGSNLLTGAAIAALAIEYKAVLHSNDVDFLRFPGLRLHNPLTETPQS
jgi:toxin-antitoxin system PIN domain toxin